MIFIQALVSEVLPIIYIINKKSIETKYIKTNQRESLIGFSYIIVYSIGFGFNTKKGNK